MIVRVRRTTSAKSSFASHSPLKRTSVFSGIDDLRGLLEVALRVRIDLLVREHGPLRRAARGIADPPRVVADDQDAGVPGALEGRHALERDGVADVDVRRGRVDPELHAQRPAERELALELALGEDVDCVTG